MKTLTITDARKQLTSLEPDQPIEISRKGQPVMVIVSPRLWERAIEALEELDDVRALEAAAEDTGPTTPWEQICAEFGWSPSDATAEEIAEARYWLGYK